MNPPTHKTPASAPTRLKIRRPDDWHLHLRDGGILAAVLPWTARTFGRAVVMPNLAHPVFTMEKARAYQGRILDLLAKDSRFTPLMTCYLTDRTSANEIREGAKSGLFFAAKLYPAGATTHSRKGVTRISHIHPILDVMQEIGLPLLIHGEAVGREVDIFDREKVFIDETLIPLRKRFPGLKMVMEHASCAQSVDYVRACPENLGATITPHHLAASRNAIFQNGINPHLYCLPIIKTEKDRQALAGAATSGDPRFFLGTDSAPHPDAAKETAFGKAGIFNAPTALSCVAAVFEQQNALKNLEAFVSENGPRFYGLAPNPDFILLEKQSAPVDFPAQIQAGDHWITVFKPGFDLFWDMSD